MSLLKAKGYDLEFLQLRLYLFKKEQDSKFIASEQCFNILQKRSSGLLFVHKWPRNIKLVQKTQSFFLQKVASHSTISLFSFVIKILQKSFEMFQAFGYEYENSIDTTDNRIEITQMILFLVLFSCAVSKNLNP